MHSRYEIMLENYCKTINIEALTLIDMTKKEILPSVIKFQDDLAKTALSKKSFMSSLSTEVEETLLSTVSSLATRLFKKLEALENAMVTVRDISNVFEAATFYRQEIFMIMIEVRGAIDQLEMMVSSKDWPYPTYGEILYSVK